MGIHLIKIQTQVSNPEYHHVLVPRDLSKPKVLKTIIQSVYVYVWDVVAWNIIERMGLRKVAVNCIVFVYQLGFLFQTVISGYWMNTFQRVELCVLHCEE
jgi:hypothetical protein